MTFDLVKRKNEVEELVGRLRETAEWAYVEREIDIRVIRESPSSRA